MEGAFVLFFLSREREERKMKKTVNKILVLVLALVMLALLGACSREIPDGLWDKALYTSDTSFGEGSKTVEVEVKAGEQSVTFTLKSDSAILGDALMEHGLIEGDDGQYGLYIKKVNGITADYDIDRSYWSFYKNGEYMMTSIDMTEFADGEHYELVYTK